MAGIGKYKIGKKFELKSGNRPSFKEMGSSPLLQTSTFDTFAAMGGSGVVGDTPTSHIVDPMKHFTYEPPAKEEEEKEENEENDKE